MMKSTKYIVIATALLAIAFEADAQRKRVSYTGDVIGLIQNSNLTEEDTLQTDRLNTGYFQIDLGFKIRPNEVTEAKADIRLNTPYGGFYGVGSTLSLRQLYVRGVIADHVKYRIGDFQHRMTPFTLHNQREVTQMNEAKVFEVQREINLYNLFVDSTKWWQQGAWAATALEFEKWLQTIELDVFTSRNRSTNFLSQPDMVQAGADLVAVQSDMLNVGLHAISQFDLPNTASGGRAYSNRVLTGDVNFNWKKDELTIKAMAEVGNSRMDFSGVDNAPGITSDYFIYGNASAGLGSAGLTATVGFRNVGPEFISSGAQSLNMDYGVAPALFGVGVNTLEARSLSLYDLYAQPGLYNPSMSPVWMARPIQWNNATPFGVATPNRTGLDAKLEYSLKNWMNLSGGIAKLQEIQTYGTQNTRAFNVLDAGAQFFVHNAIGWDKALVIHGAVRKEHTKRVGLDNERISLRNNLIDAGASFNLWKGLNLLCGYKKNTSIGTEVRSTYNQFNEITGYTHVVFDGGDQLLAAGIKYDFDDRSHLSAIYQTVDSMGNPNSGESYTNFNSLVLLFRSTF